MPRTRSPHGAAAIGDILREYAAAGRLKYAGTVARGEGFTVELPGDPVRVRRLSAQRMLEWMDGFGQAQFGRFIPPAERDQGVLAEVRTVLVNPSLTDQWRILSRVCMDRADPPVGINELTRRMGVPQVRGNGTKKSVSEALHLGRPGYGAMLAVLGLDENLRPDLAELPDGPVDVVPAEGWAEPDALSAIRAMAYAHQEGVLRWAGPMRRGGGNVIDVNAAMHATKYPVHVGEYEIGVPRANARGWLCGFVDGFLPELGDRFYLAATYPNLRPDEVDDNGA